MGAKWFYRESNDEVFDAAQFLDKVASNWFYQEKKLSTRFTYAFKQEAYALEQLPPEAVQAEVLRLLERHKEEMAKKVELEPLAKDLTQFSQHLKAHGEHNLEMLADFLSLATFIAKEKQR